MQFTKLSVLFWNRVGFGPEHRWSESVELHRAGLVVSELISLACVMPIIFDAELKCLNMILSIWSIQQAQNKEEILLLLLCTLEPEKPIFISHLCHSVAMWPSARGEALWEGLH